MTIRLLRINKYHADETTVTKGTLFGKQEMAGELWYGHNDMFTGKRKATTYGALDAFFPAVLSALGGDLEPCKTSCRIPAIKWWTLRAASNLKNTTTNPAKSKTLVTRFVPKSLNRRIIFITTLNDEKYSPNGAKLSFDDTGEILQN